MRIHTCTNTHSQTSLTLKKLLFATVMGENDPMAVAAVGEYNCTSVVMRITDNKSFDDTDTGRFTETV